MNSILFYNQLNYGKSRYNVKPCVQFLVLETLKGRVVCTLHRVTNVMTVDVLSQVYFMYTPLCPMTYSENGDAGVNIIRWSFIIMQI